MADYQLHDSDNDLETTRLLINVATPDVTFPGIEDVHQNTAYVEFINLPQGKVFYKKQCRKNRLGRQVITDGVVHMTANYMGQLLKIRGWVEREPEAAKLYKDPNGPVLICGEDQKELNLIKGDDVAMSITEDGNNVQSFSVDLGKMYNGPHKPVFELARSDRENRMNKFQLLIQLVFVDNQSSQKFVSPTFTCCTRKPIIVDNAAEGEPSSKIRKQDLQAQSPESGFVDSGDSGLSDNSVRHKEILVDVLRAKTAYIDDLVIANDCHMETSKADIAYHLKIRDHEICEELEEGDIVGFYGDEESGETYIQHLRSGNIHNAVHAGVISRSHWMEGNKSHEKGSVTDTVCVIGIVNVKVVGSVENGERIYASRDHPGKAIPQSHMPVGSFLRKKHVLLGMAMETKKSSRWLDEVNLTKCFVCIVLDVSRKELLQEIEDLYITNEKRTGEQIKLASKKTWRRLKCCFVMTAVILALIIYMLYQWLAPGSMFRYWLCRRGAMPNHDLHFIFEDAYKRFIPVHGIQFTYHGLQDKVDVEFVEHTDSAYYYLNLDRCAYYWSDGAAGNNIGGHIYIGGGRILSVFKNCSTVYECSEQQNSWKEIDIQRNQSCNPLPDG